MSVLEKDESEGREMKRRMLELLAPFQAFCIENKVQGAYIPFTDLGEAEFRYSAGRLADKIKPVLTQFGSIYLVVKERSAVEPTTSPNAKQDGQAKTK